MSVFQIFFVLRKSLKIILQDSLAVKALLATFIVEILSETTGISVKFSILSVRMLTTEMRG